MPDRDSTPIQRLTRMDAPTRVLLVDPMVGPQPHEDRAQLRSVPYLTRLGFRHYTFPTTWRDPFELVPYEFVHADELPGSLPETGLVQVVSQAAIEKGTGGQILKRLLTDSDGPLVVVVEATDVIVPEITTARPLKDSVPGVVVLSYKDHVRRRIDSRLSSSVPTTSKYGSLNLWVHETADLHGRFGHHPATIGALFDYDAAPAESPIWTIPEWFAENDRSAVLEEYSDRVRAALRSWFERGQMQQVANAIIEVLDECDYDIKTIRERRGVDTDTWQH